MTWFDRLTGFRETTADQVRDKITVQDEYLLIREAGKAIAYGRLETPSLEQLRDEVQSHSHQIGRIVLREVVSNAVDLHTNISNNNSLFQVASQFNLLEMCSPSFTPEHGVGIYESDPTQGPACAIAAGAGTIYRNYFMPVNGKIGQSKDNQVDCLADLGKALGNTNNRLWQMQNGYALATQDGLVEISKRLTASSEKDLDEFRKLLRVGIQLNTQVTINDSANKVTQVFCSALPVAYCTHEPAYWKSFATLVLEAAYEATICAAILNMLNTGNNRVFLTLLGGGAFGNEPEWITDSILRVLRRYSTWDLDVAIVSYKSSNQSVRNLIDQSK